MSTSKDTDDKFALAASLFRTTDKSVQDIADTVGLDVLVVSMVTSGLRRLGTRAAVVSPTHLAFGEAVRNGRILHGGYSKAEASRIFGLRKGVLNKIEKGEYDPSLSVMTRLCAGLGITMEFTVDDRHPSRTKDPDVLEDGATAPESSG